MCDASITDYSLFLTKKKLQCTADLCTQDDERPRERKITLTTADGVLRLLAHTKLTALEIN